MTDPSKFLSASANKIVFVVLAALFLSQVWNSYGKLRKRSVAYDQDVVSNMEQLYPSFTMCPEHEYAGMDNFNDVDYGMDIIFNYKKDVLDELLGLKHIVKSEDG